MREHLKQAVGTIAGLRSSTMARFDFPGGGPHQSYRGRAKAAHLYRKRQRGMRVAVFGNRHAAKERTSFGTTKPVAAK